jgi:hypothetical protein
MKVKEGKLSNASIQGRLRQLEKAKTERLDTMLRSVMANPVGRQFVYWLIFDACDMNGITYDPALQAIHVGQRSVGARLLQEFQRVTPNEWTDMLVEQSRENATYQVLQREALTEPPEEKNDA